MTASLRERDVFFLFGCVQVGTRFSLCSVVSSMHLLTAGAVSRVHLVGVAVGVSAHLGGRGGSDALVVIVRWIRYGVPLRVARDRSTLLIDKWG